MKPRKKKKVLITIDYSVHEWAKESIENFSGFVETEVLKLSCSINQLSGTIENKKI